MLALITNVSKFVTASINHECCVSLDPLHNAQTLTTCTCVYPVRHFGSHNVHKGTDFKNGGNGRQVEVQCARGSFGNYLRLQQYNLVLKKGKMYTGLRSTKYSS